MSEIPPLSPKEQMVALRDMLRCAIANGWHAIASTVSDQILDLRRAG